MRKKKLLALGMVAALSTTAVVGGTLAYFTDKDSQTNVFTYGNVKVDLFEDFNSDNLNLVPAVFVSKDGSQNYGTWINKIEKEVYVENEGSEEVYTRVHIAVPQLAEAINGTEIDGVKIDTSKITKEGKDILNLTRDEFTTVDGKWNWGTAADQTWQGRTPNTYDVDIKGIKHKVYVVTYESKLKAADGSDIDATCDAINGVFMHSEVTNEMIAALDQKYADAQGSPYWSRVYVVAEAAQADGFNIEVDADGNKTEIANAETDGTAAFKALNTAFGDVTNDYELTEADFLAAAKGDTFKEWNALSE